MLGARAGLPEPPRVLRTINKLLGLGRLEDESRFSLRVLEGRRFRRGILLFFIRIALLHAPAAGPFRDSIASFPKFLLGDARPQEVFTPRCTFVRGEEVQNTGFAVVQTTSSLIYGVYGRIRQQINFLEFWPHTLDICH